MSAQTDLLMPKKYKSEMTWWSRHDPVMLPHGHTDHWTKMKARTIMMSPAHSYTGGAEALQTPLPVTARNGGKAVSFAASHAGVKYNTRYPASPRYLGNQDFDEQIALALRQSLPPQAPRPRTTPLPSIISTSFNARAREGYKYWYQERPKPTMFGRYGIGSYKTVLGLGNAPRT